jgi:phosphatidylglycerophosphate synthase
VTIASISSHESGPDKEMTLLEAPRSEQPPAAAPVGTPRGFRDSLEALKRAQKTSKGAPLYSRLINRRLGRLFAAVAHVLRLTPNQVTVISACFTFAGIALIALAAATPVTSIAVVALLIIGYGLDAADGQLARLRGGGSAVGEWLDHVVDAIKIASLHLAVLMNWYRFEDAPDSQLLIPIGFQAVASVMFFVVILNDHIRRARRKTTAAIMQGDGSSSWLYSFAVVPTDYGLLCLVFATMAWHASFVWIYAALLAANAAFLALALTKWFREIRAYD